MIFVVAGCSQPSQPKKTDFPLTETLQLEQVEAAFQNEEMELVKDRTLKPGQFKILDVKPATYRIGSFQDNFMLVYVFKSFGDRKEAEKELKQQLEVFKVFDVRYKGQDIDHVREITAEFELGRGSSRTSGRTLDEKGYLRMGSGSSNSVIARKDDVCILTVDWNGKKEVFELKAE